MLPYRCYMAASVCVLLLWLGTAGPVAAQQDGAKVPKKVIIGYVTSWGNTLPNPKLLTHINYAFGAVNKSFDGIVIQNPDRLRQVVELKKAASCLKVLLSIGGWASGGFSEMADNDTGRVKFALACAATVQEFGLDGIDIDWEYPTSSMAGITASPDDRENFLKLMKAVRQAIGSKKLLTIASISGAEFIDFAKVMPWIDYVNIMAYDMGVPPKHQAALYRSGMSGDLTVEESVKAHLAAGIPAAKLVMGVPFYGHGINEVASDIKYKDIFSLKKVVSRWDDTAKAAYLVDSRNRFICSYEDARSICMKCRYLKSRGLSGMMLWNTEGDTSDDALEKLIFKELEATEAGNNTPSSGVAAGPAETGKQDRVHEKS